MAICQNCGDAGAPEQGVCGLCGLPVGSAPPRSELPTAVVEDTPVIDPFGDAETAVVLPTLQPVAQESPTASIPVVEPVTESAATTSFVVVAPIAEPAEAEPLVLEPLETEPEPVRRPPARVRRKTAKPIEVAPIQVEPRTTIALTARNEYSSVPADDPPVVGLMVEIAVSGRPLALAGSGPVAHVILALDVSASMDDEDKYPVLRAAIASMLKDLRAPDAADVLLSVVLFSKGATTLYRGVPARDLDPSDLFGKIEADPLCFGRYTDVGGALSRAGRIAYDQAKANPHLPIRIYLLTDGKPQDIALAQAAAARVAKVPVDLHGLAFGADADVRVLQDLFAGRRGGTVKSVRRDTIGTAFERVAEVAQQVVATRARVRLDLAPGVVGGEAYRYRPARVRFPEPAFDDGKHFRTDLGTIEKGRKYSLLFEIRPPETEERITTIGEVRVEIPGSRVPVVESLTLTLSRRDAGLDVGELDQGVRTARDILGALSADDPQTALRALRLRRQLYEEEKRDPGLLTILDKAIELLETNGNLDGLSPGDHATLLAHTCTGSS